MSLYEPVMNALFALLQQKCAADFPTISRRIRLWDDIAQNVNVGTSPVRQPALYLYDGIGFGGGKTRYEQRRGLPHLVTIHRTIVIYARLPGSGGDLGPDSITPGGSVFAPLVESVEGAFTADADGALRLVTNGVPLVHHCWIEGDSHWITGEIDPGGQGMCTIPVMIRFPQSATLS